MRLQKFWQKLSLPERIALFVLMDLLTNRDNVTSAKRIAKETCATLKNVSDDPMTLGEKSGAILESWLSNWAGNIGGEPEFHIVYQKLYTKVSTINQ